MAYSSGPYGAQKEINILLLGETGVGKSTFINAFANYLTYETMEEAGRGKLLNLIPTMFIVADADYNEKKVTNGKDANECMRDGQSSTQGCKSYLFEYEDCTVRLIDTPGIGDTSGIAQDRVNFENLLAFIAQYKYLHAICILLKPNQPKITVSFEYCIKQLLSSLEKSASKNIIFIFTNSRSSFYKPGDTVRALRPLLEQVKKRPPHVEIIFKKESTYCLDNEAYRFLVAMENGIIFSPSETQDFGNSWVKSSQECSRFMDRILGTADTSAMIPHKVQDTISVNDARRLILLLSQPLAEIAQLIQNSLKVLQQHEQEVGDSKGDIEALKRKLFMPVLDLKRTDFPEPRTVCHKTECCETYQVGDVLKTHFRQRCHDPCYLQNVPKEVMGDAQLLNCWAIDEATGLCNICHHEYNIHMHIYYETTVFQDKMEDATVQKNIKTKEDAKREAEKHQKDVRLRCEALRGEQNMITKTMASFAQFLKNNAIAPYNDSFKSYLEHLIENEKILTNQGSQNKEIIAGMEKMLREYEQEKSILEAAINASVGVKGTASVASEKVLESIKALYKLNITGKMIKDAVEAQEKGRRQAFRGIDIRVPIPKGLRRKSFLSQTFQLQPRPRSSQAPSAPAYPNLNKLSEPEPDTKYSKTINELMSLFKKI